MPDPVTSILLKAAWAGMLLGVVSGAVIGLFFAKEEWMGGYSSWRRRLTRLGHISFFGLGFVNFLFAFTHHAMHLDPAWAKTAAGAFLTGAATMPAVCFLSAWKEPLRHFFFIPVCSVALGILCTLLGWP
jgi:hypothetical protein